MPQWTLKSSRSWRKWGWKPLLVEPGPEPAPELVLGPELEPGLGPEPEPELAPGLEPEPALGPELEPGLVLGPEPVPAPGHERVLGPAAVLPVDSFTGDYYIARGSGID